ncbi:MAG: flagellar L-ring protein precursor FlgH [Alcanivorax sp.]|jgi:flagellar L-ring protein precursor FlgH
MDQPNYYLEPAMREPTGAVYQEGYNVLLFEDLRARRVGDIVTVVLAEATDATKSSDTTLDKSSSTVIDNPIAGGLPAEFRNGYNLGFDLSSEQSFEGESGANQNNRLSGSVAVTVTRVFPGGNLYVQGEKWIQINQGDEYVRLRGIIRSVDISATNTILSTQVADARISYSSIGADSDVNKPGWLTRFFMNPVWPF